MKFKVIIPAGNCKLTGDLMRLLNQYNVNPQLFCKFVTEQTRCYQPNWLLILHIHRLNYENISIIRRNIIFTYIFELLWKEELRKGNYIPSINILFDLFCILKLFYKDYSVKAFFSTLSSFSFFYRSLFNS